MATQDFLQEYADPTGAEGEPTVQMPGEVTPETTREDKLSELSLEAMVPLLNIVDELDEDTLKEISKTVYEGYVVDKESRSDWEDSNEEYMKLATQVVDRKAFPWQNASNVKYPLLTIAALQFAARAYQTLLPNANLVRARVIGEDPAGEKAQRAYRVSKYMSYQLLEEDPGWEDSMDRLTLVLPILGNIFKKTYYDGVKNVSEMILPKDLVVNYYAKSLELASRKTHMLYYYPNEVVEQIRLGYMVEHEHEVGGEDTQGAGEAIFMETMDEAHGVAPPAHDPDTPILYLEQHCFLDLDDDGYKEPYVVTMHAPTQKVVRITARYSESSIERNDKDEVAKITPIEYFTNFIFIPDPTSGVYGLGFGVLLGPLNETANTLINQLVDAGTLSNLPSGFIGRGVRIPHGDTPLRPGEWRSVPVMGDDLRKGIVPLPRTEPSQVLYTLLGMMIESGHTLGSITDVMQGKNPGQNQPFSTTSEVLKQGMQVFTAVHKRMHRSLKKEYQKLYRLNSLYLTKEKYFTVLDPKTPEQANEVISPQDFESDSFDIAPASDPNQLTSSEKLEKAQTLMALLQLGTINRVETTRRILEAQEHEGIDILMDVPEPGPNFEQQIELQRVELEKARLELDKQKVASQAKRDEANSVLALAKAEMEKASLDMEQMRMKLEMFMRAQELQADQQNKQADRKTKQFDSMAKMGVENRKADIAAAGLKAKSSQQTQQRPRPQK